MYAVDGARRLPEHELDHLAGYAGSAPVRIGNGAVDQRQTDVLGEVMIAFERGPPGRSHRDPQQLVAATLPSSTTSPTHWDRPDNGLWEIRGPPAALHPLPGDGLGGVRPRGPRRRGARPGRTSWTAGGRSVTRCGPRCWSAASTTVRGTLTQHYDTTEVDASLLMVPARRLPPRRRPAGGRHHPRGRGGPDGRRLPAPLPHRDRGGRAAGGRAPVPGLLLLAGPVYALAGRRADAEELFDRLCGLANDVGLLSEEYDVANGRMAGNFPQAFSHLTLVQAALQLAGLDPVRY